MDAIHKRAIVGDDLKGARVMVQFLLVLALVFASFVAVFALQNAQPVFIHFFAWERETSVAVIVLASAAAGALSAVLAGLMRQLSAGLRYRQLKGELARARKALDEEKEAKRALADELQEAQTQLQTAPTQTERISGEEDGSGGTPPQEDDPSRDVEQPAADRSAGAPEGESETAFKQPDL